ncbi:MAG: hypothetical protein Q9219_004370 [cf. Caloplaca sp. 3 TL-2023]
MDTLTLSLSSPKSLKRGYSDTGLENTVLSSMNDSVPLKAEGTLGFRPNGTSLSEHDGSSASAENTPIPNTQPSSTPSAAHHSATVAPIASDLAKKRPKLTSSEKEARRLEKEAREREKVEQKAKKEEERIRKEQEKKEETIRREQEKAKKEEERLVKQAEKDKKRQEKEEQSKLKEEEKRKKEQEKDKKNKSQLRLNAFFPRPSLSNDGSIPSPTRASPSPANSRRSSITSLNDNHGITRDKSVPATPSKPKTSDFDRRFPPFFLQSHTTLAPCNRFERDQEDLQFACRGLDDNLTTGSAALSIPSLFNAREMLRVSPYKRRKLDHFQPSLKEIVAQLNGIHQDSIDLTSSKKLKSSQQPLDLLKSVSVKFLKFAEDVRPPYVGTYTRLQKPPAARKICRNPFRRQLPNTDYDYDSEAEWEDPGEGEDLDSEGEEEVESEDGDDMEGFLDDEDAADGTRMQQKRRLLTKDLEPVSTGLCWQSTDDDVSLQEMRQYRMEFILETPTKTVDPYSTAYWPDAIPASAPTRGSQSTMDPPRIPLNASNRGNLPLLPNPATMSRDGLKPQMLSATNPLFASKVPPGPKKMVTPDAMEDFKRAVQGSDLTKAGLIEVLKKQ